MARCFLYSGDGGEVGGWVGIPLVCCNMHGRLGIAVPWGCRTTFHELLQHLATTWQVGTVRSAQFHPPR